MAAQSVEAAAGVALMPGLPERLADLRSSLVAIPLQAYASQNPAEARRAAAQLRELRSMLDAHIGAAVRAVERLVPSRDTRQLLAGDFGLDARAVHHELRDAHAMASAALAEQQAAEGVISARHAVVIGRALRDLPESTTQGQKELAERALISEAQRLAPRELEARGRRITDVFLDDPEVDATEGALLHRREAAARRRVSLTMWDNRDGSWSGKFTLPELQARMLKTVIDAHAAPRRAHLQPTEAVGRHGHGDADKPYDTKAGEALLALIEHLPVDRLASGGGSPARIVITIAESKLRSAVAGATLATGERISAGELRRLACTHGILPAVLGGASVPVDLGRSQRLFSSHQRDALASIDGGCIAPGCDRPPAWCEAHHGADPWHGGGKTDLKDGYLLCSTHHHEAHQRRWKFGRLPDGGAQVDRGRGWERNHRYRP